MDCTFINENLFAIMEGTLTPGELAAAREHIGSCDKCGETYTGFTETIGIIGQDKRLEINPFIRTRTLQLLETRYSPRYEHKQRLYARILQPALVAFSMLLAVFLGFTLGKSGTKGLPGTTGESLDMQSAKSELFIPDMTDDEKTLFPNP
jgi:predicted anti-sigma-YlaC factor YlaD